MLPRAVIRAVRRGAAAAAVGGVSRAGPVMVRVACYHENVINHFEMPRNVGARESARRWC